MYLEIFVAAKRGGRGGSARKCTKKGPQSANPCQEVLESCCSLLVLGRQSAGQMAAPCRLPSNFRNHWYQCWFQFPWPRLLQCPCQYDFPESNPSLSMFVKYVSNARWLPFIHWMKENFLLISGISDLELPAREKRG